MIDSYITPRTAQNLLRDFDHVMREKDGSLIEIHPGIARDYFQQQPRESLVHVMAMGGTLAIVTGD